MQPSITNRTRAFPENNNEANCDATRPMSKLELWCVSNSTANDEFGGQLRNLTKATQKFAKQISQELYWLSLHSACQIKDLKRRSSTVAKRLAQRKPFFTPAFAFIMQSSVHEDALKDLSVAKRKDPTRSHPEHGRKDFHRRQYSEGSLPGRQVAADSYI